MRTQNKRGYESDLIDYNIKQALLKKASSRQPVESTQIREGDKVVHNDKHGVSAGFADSDAMHSRGEIKVHFTFGPRKGECRWVKLSEIKSVEQGFED